MFIVVSNNSRLPHDLEGFKTELWSVDEFFSRATSEEGIEIDEGLWYDVAYLTPEIYDGLNSFGNIYYYRFSDTPEVSFPMANDIKLYTVETKQPEIVTPQPVEQPTPEQSVSVEQPVVEQSVQPTTEPVVQQPQQVEQSQPVVEQSTTQTNDTTNNDSDNNSSSSVFNTIQSNKINVNPNNIKLTDSHMKKTMYNLLQFDDYDAATPQSNRKAAPAKVILFGSSKGGTGKTFTCLMCAYWYAKMHPDQRIALADFDIIDGQIGITINKLTPTMNDFYKLCKGGKNEFEHLDNCKVKSSNFSPNIDFYLAPAQDIPEVTNDTEYWTKVFQLLITNYDVVFFDSGIDYQGKAPISQLYKIADKIIVTSNPSINSVKSVIKQFKTLSGQRINNVFKPGEDILSRVNVVLTRVYDNDAINATVANNIQAHNVPIIAAFGNIDDMISQVQWYQMWDLIDSNKDITDSLEEITDM